MTFPIITIQNRDTLEQLGTKTKFWFYDEDETTPKLFKIGRPGTGENWAEKVTCEIAKLLGIPSAYYELAIWEGERGVSSPSFVPNNGRLIHGNELLAKLKDIEQTTRYYQIRTHTVTVVVAILRTLKNKVSLPIGYSANSYINTIEDLFVGYILFDCLVSNPDRHHENWGIVYDIENKKMHLAPSYDHASGLGCRVSDDECQRRLTTTDYNYSVKHFVTRTKSSFYNKKKKRIKTFDAFLAFAKYNKNAANFWIDELEKLNKNLIKNIFEQIPSGHISQHSVDFACRIIEENKKRLIESRGIISS